MCVNGRIKRTVDVFAIPLTPPPPDCRAIAFEVTSRHRDSWPWHGSSWDWPWCLQSETRIRRFIWDGVDDWNRLELWSIIKYKSFDSFWKRPDLRRGSVDILNEPPPPVVRGEDLKWREILLHSLFIPCIPPALNATAVSFTPMAPPLPV